MVVRSVAGAVLVLPDGRWVMQRRTDDAPTDPNCLAFFGGMMEEGETAEQGFTREMQEETNLDITNTPHKLVAEFEVEHHNRLLQVSLFRMDIPSMDFEIYEGKRTEAFTVEELAKRTDVSSVVPKAIKAISANKMKTRAVATALLTLPDGRWVMQRRTDDAPTDPGILSFFGGGIDPGETPDQAFVRELSEETNLSIGKYKLAGVLVDREHYPVVLEAHMYHMPIPNLEFEVYEGVRAEAYSPQELGERSDISALTKATLKQFGAKKWH